MRKASIAAGGVLLLAGLVALAVLPDESAGALWASVAPNSLVGFGAFVEKKVDPDLWTGAILPALRWPAWVPAFALGAVLLLAARPWRRSRR